MTYLIRVDGEIEGEYLTLEMARTRARELAHEIVLHSVEIEQAEVSREDAEAGRIFHETVW